MKIQKTEQRDYSSIGFGSPPRRCRLHDAINIFEESDDVPILLQEVKNICLYSQSDRESYSDAGRAAAKKTLAPPRTGSFDQE